MAQVIPAAVQPTALHRLLEGVSLTVERSGRTILSEVDVVVHAGECVCVMGRIGCGKSTLLQVLAQLLPAKSGCVLLDAKPFATPGPRVAHLPQPPPIAPWLNCWDNLLLGARLAGKPIDADVGAIAEVLEEAGLEGTWDRPAAELSTGMQQLLGIGRCLLLNPDVLLLDEPFSHLDYSARARVQAALGALLHDRSMGLIYVTHDPGEAIRLADRVIVLGGEPTRAIAEVQVRPWAGRRIERTSERGNRLRTVLEHWLVNGAAP